MSPLEPFVVLLLIALGGVVAIDGTSFGQFMISRPLVAATLGGWIVGAPAEGALIGLILEAFHLAVLPVGAARYPEGGPAAVVGGALFGASTHNASILLLAVVFVLVLEWLGGQSVRYMRQANIRLVHPHPIFAMDDRELERRHLAAIAVDFGRGMLLVAAGLLTIGLLLALLAPFWGLGERVPEVLLIAAVAGLLAGSARVVGTRQWVIAAGAATGAVLLLAVG
jgi:mannose PTS system EIIC component